VHQRCRLAPEFHSFPRFDPVVRLPWGVLKLIKVVGTHSGGLFLFQLRRSNCNQIKGLAKFDDQLAIAPGRVRKYEIEQSAFFAGRLFFEQFCGPVGQFDNGDAFLQVALVRLFVLFEILSDGSLLLTPLS